MNNFGGNGLMKMNQKTLQYQIMKRRLVLIKILVISFISAWLDHSEKIEPN